MNLTSVLAVLLFLSLAANVFLFIRLRQKSKRPESYEVKHLMQDLLAGQALVKITRVASADVFLRSPRHSSE